MSKILAVYPYTRTYAPFLAARKQGKAAAFGRQVLLCPEGFGMTNKDAGQIDLRKDIGILVRSDTDAALAQSDALLVPDGDYNEELAKDILRRASDFLDRGREVYCYMPWGEEVRQLLGDSAGGSLNFNLLEHPKRLYHPKASIVFVGELFGNVNGTDIALALHEHFSAKGYRASAILASRVANFYGLHTTEEIFPCGIENPEKQIDYINNYFRELENKEHPELIVVQIPGGLVPINDIVTNGHGIYAYMLSQVISPDAFVLCSPFDRFDYAMFEKFNTLFSYRLGFGIDVIHMSNAQPDGTNMAHRYKLEWTYATLAKVDRFIQAEYPAKNKLRVCCALRHQDRLSLCTQVEDKLLGMGVASAVHTGMIETVESR